jgi:hypothetical protein
MLETLNPKPGSSLGVREKASLASLSPTRRLRGDWRAARYPAICAIETGERQCRQRSPLELRAASEVRTKGGVWE